MKIYKTILINLAALLILIPGMASAYDGNWKRGDVYYRMVCTDCHKNQPVGKVPPDSRTQAEWAAYLEADQHAKGQDTVSKYVSKSFRDSIAGENKAAAKFANVPEDELFADIKAILLRGAKDGDAPAGCR